MRPVQPPFTPEKLASQSLGTSPGAREERFERRFVKRAAAGMQLVAMHAMDDEEAVEPGAARAGKVGEGAVADRQRARLVDFAAAQMLEPLQGGGVDRGVGLAEGQNAAADRRIAFGEGAGAVDEILADADDNVGIGAEHRQVARLQRRELFVVVVEGVSLRSSTRPVQTT